MDIKIAQQMTITELVLENQKLKQERDEARKESEYYKERYEQLKEIPKWYNGREIPAQIKEETK